MFSRLPVVLDQLRKSWPLPLLVLIASCGTATFIVQQYDGQPLPNSHIAIVRLNGDQPLRLEELDGELLGYELRDSGARVHIEILPGEHELGLSEGPGLPLKRRRFRAEAGRVYRPMLVRTQLGGGDLGSTPWVIGIYEVDRDSDEVLREISQIPHQFRLTPHRPAPPAQTPPVASSPLAPPVASTMHPAPQASSPAVSPQSSVGAPIMPPSVPTTTPSLPGTLAPPTPTSVTPAPSLAPAPPSSPRPLPSQISPSAGPEPAGRPPEATPL